VERFHLQKRMISIDGREPKPAVGEKGGKNCKKVFGIWACWGKKEKSFVACHKRRKIKPMKGKKSARYFSVRGLREGGEERSLAPKKNRIFETGERSGKSSARDWSRTEREKREDQSDCGQRS